MDGRYGASLPGCGEHGHRSCSVYWAGRDFAGWSAEATQLCRNRIRGPLVEEHRLQQRRAHLAAVTDHFAQHWQKLLGGHCGQQIVDSPQQVVRLSLIHI